MSRDLRLVIVTGLSGSGKSTATRALEDLGYFCVDNLPAGLLPKFLELQTAASQLDKFAFVMDTRERKFLKNIPRVMDEVQEQGFPIEILFLECSNEVLLRRFSETRRPHPLAPEGGGVLDGIQKERSQLQSLKERADMVLDSSDLTVHELRHEVQDRFSRPGTQHELTIRLISFGFRKGVPTDADIMMDVRFLPNPHFLPELRDSNGTEPEVAQYVLQHEVTQQFLDRFCSMINFLIPHYVAEGKSYLTIAIGCTGGQHRSVAITEAMGKCIQGESFRIRLRHRDLEDV